MTTHIFHEIKTTSELGLKSVSLYKSLCFPLNGEASHSHSRVPCFSSLALWRDNILVMARSLHHRFQISCGDGKWKPPVGLTNDFKGRSEVMCGLLAVPFFFFSPSPHLTKSTPRLCPIRSRPGVTWVPEDDASG